MRECPKCGVELSDKHERELNSNWCPECHGLWVSQEVLLGCIREYLAESGVPERRVPLQEMPPAPSKLSCPDCNDSLERIKLRAVEVERCAVCRHLFLDRGKAGLIIRRVAMAARQKRKKQTPSRLSSLQTVRTRGIPG